MCVHVWAEEEGNIRDLIPNEDESLETLMEEESIVLRNLPGWSLSHHDRYIRGMAARSFISNRARETGIFTIAIFLEFDPVLIILDFAGIGISNKRRWLSFCPSLSLCYFSSRPPILYALYTLFLYRICFVFLPE